MRHDVGHDDSDDAGRVFPQAQGERIGAVIHFFGKLFGFGAQFAAYFGAVFQCPRNGGNGYAEPLGKIFQRGVFRVAHGCLIIMTGFFYTHLQRKRFFTE